MCNQNTLSLGDKVRAKGTMWVEHQHKWYHTPTWKPAKLGIITEFDYLTCEGKRVCKIAVVITRWGYTTINVNALDKR